jgi:hypothetical protein
LQLDNIDSNKAVQSIFPEIQSLLHQCAEVFANKVLFPPPRPFIHAIPLIPGSTLVNI